MNKQDWIILRLLMVQTITKHPPDSWESKQWCKAMIYLVKKYDGVSSYIDQLAEERKQYGTR